MENVDKQIRLEVWLHLLILVFVSITISFLVLFLFDTEKIFNIPHYPQAIALGAILAALLIVAQWGVFSLVFRFSDRNKLVDSNPLKKNYNGLFLATEAQLLTLALLFNFAIFMPDILIILFLYVPTIAALGFAYYLVSGKDLPRTKLLIIAAVTIVAINTVYSFMGHY